MTVWSPQEIQVLREYSLSGASATRIAARLKRTTGAVRAVAQKLGIDLKTKKQVRAANGINQYWSSNRSF